MENRPQLLEMLDAVKAGEFDAIVVRHHDRIPRTESLREWGIIYGCFQESGTLVASPYDGIADLDSLEDQVKSFIVGRFSAKENQKRRERQAEDQLKKARKGQSIGGKYPPATYWDRNDLRSAQLHERDKKGG